MNVFEEILENIDIDKEVRKVLGLSDPEKYPQVEQPLGSPAMVWLKTNQMLLGIGVVILILVIFLLTLK